MDIDASRKREVEASLLALEGTRQAPPEDGAQEQVIEETIQLVPIITIPDASMKLDEPTKLALRRVNRLSLPAGPIRDTTPSPTAIPLKRYSHLPRSTPSTPVTPSPRETQSLFLSVTQETTRGWHPKPLVLTPARTSKVPITGSHTLNRRYSLNSPGSRPISPARRTNRDSAFSQDSLTRSHTRERSPSEETGGTKSTSTWTLDSSKYSRTSNGSPDSSLNEAWVEDKDSVKGRSTGDLNRSVSQLPSLPENRPFKTKRKARRASVYDENWDGSFDWQEDANEDADVPRPQPNHTQSPSTGSSNLSEIEEGVPLETNLSIASSMKSSDVSDMLDFQPKDQQQNGHRESSDSSYRSHKQLDRLSVGNAAKQSGHDTSKARGIWPPPEETVTIKGGPLLEIDQASDQEDEPASHPPSPIMFYNGDSDEEPATLLSKSKSQPFFSSPKKRTQDTRYQPRDPRVVPEESDDFLEAILTGPPPPEERAFSPAPTITTGNHKDHSSTPSSTDSSNAGYYVNELGGVSNTLAPTPKASKRLSLRIFGLGSKPSSSKTSPNPASPRPVSFTSSLPTPTQSPKIKPTETSRPASAMSTAKSATGEPSRHNSVRFVTREQTERTSVDTDQISLTSSKQFKLPPGLAGSSDLPSPASSRSRATGQYQYPSISSHGPKRSLNNSVTSFRSTQSTSYAQGTVNESEEGYLSFENVSPLPMMGMRETFLAQVKEL